MKSWVMLGEQLSLEDYIQVVRYHVPVNFSEQYEARVTKARNLVDKWTEEEKPMYGVTTGFGSLCTKTISREDAAALQRNILLSHATSVGAPLSEEVVRGTMLMVLQNLGQGYSGVKQEMVLEPLVAYAAYDLKADVTCHFTREEQITGTLLRHNFDTYTESKVDADGRIHGVKIHMNLDAGAYQTISPSYLRTAGRKLGKTYAIPNIKFTGYSVCTTTPTNGSFRSWGSSEEAIALEPHWNIVAQELGMDPIDFRLKNVREPYDKDVFHGASISNTHFREVLTQGRERFDWDRRKAECEEKNAAGGRYRCGVGDPPWRPRRR